MSQYIVSARKYRPNTFDSVVGQGHVTDTLTHSLLSGQVAHAYLFCGPRGVGKTTVARILAKAINCENLSKEGEACNVCPSCKAFDINSSFNIFELDGASNNSVENIRALVEQVRVPPSQGKYKVYIIDEVHMLSQAAFNAFLKTLEEPPPYVKFILATTEKHKILPTILSRCQAFDFRRIPVPEIAAHLRTICTTENIQAENEALVIISQKGDGSLRDSLSIFDRIASQSKGNITYAGVLESLQLLDYDYFFRMTDALMREDMTEVFLTLADIQKRGFDGEAFISGFSEHLRDVLLCKDTATATLLTHGDKIKARYLLQAQAIRKSSLITYLDLINQCEINYSRALNKWLHIEMALVRMCYMHRRQDNETVAPSGAEKKKPDQSVSIAPPAPKSENGKAKVEEIPVEIPEVKPPNAYEEHSEPIVKKETKPLTSLSGGLSSLADQAADMAIPSLKGLGSLKKKAEDQHEEEKKKIPVLTLPPILDFWKEYIESHSSPSLKQTMLEAIVEIKGEKMIIIRTGHQTGKNRITAESNLLDGLRSLVRVPELQIVIDIDPDLDKSRDLIKPKKLLSNREKFEILAAKNPLINQLRDNLDLIPDQED
ncbi:MAG: DNA polymerase III subunit gamma/tau [Saprospiraceae bacterium]|nr:DNA polymerase III subunit gamma/tau [Candidatus Opimibacter skivensis]